MVSSLLPSLSLWGNVVSWLCTSAPIVWLFWFFSLSQFFLLPYCTWMPKWPLDLAFPDTIIPCSHLCFFPSQQFHSSYSPDLSVCLQVCLFIFPTGLRLHKNKCYICLGYSASEPPTMCGTQELLKKHLLSEWTDEHQPQICTIHDSCDHLFFFCPASIPLPFSNKSSFIFLWLQAQLISMFYSLATITSSRLGLGPKFIQWDLILTFIGTTRKRVAMLWACVSRASSIYFAV